MAAGYCDVAVPVPLHETFTYKIPPGLDAPVCAGCRVIVPFGSRKLVGVVTAVLDRPRVEGPLKELQELLDVDPVLPQSLLALARWASEYYAAPPGEMVRAMLPLHEEFARRERVHLGPLGSQRLAALEANVVRSENEEADYRILSALEGGKTRSASGLVGRVKGGRGLLSRMRRSGWVEITHEIERRKPRGQGVSTSLWKGDWSIEAPPVLTGEQESALSEIDGLQNAGGFSTVLLHGVTGSGKTEVYSRAIQCCLARGKAALVLVPEIALTPAVAGQFAARFGHRVAVLHSGLSPRERSSEWWRLRRGEARVAIGTRSAVFAPVGDLGLVIVDEEQDGSYKQEETPRYHGRDTAVVRAKLEGAVAVLGTATPALETSYHARTGRYRVLAMNSRVADRSLAEVSVVDMRNEFQETRKAEIFSRELVEGIKRSLSAGGQVLLLRNRRGYANILLCRKCGATVQCADCSISLAFHRVRRRLLCHYCGYARGVPKSCEKCGSEHLYYIGEGTEKVEEITRQTFPSARIARLDRDTAGGRGRAERILRQFARGELDILVGTQMIAKGHDFQGVSLVGVLSADSILGLPDFRAAERTFQLLTQVAGRAGRGELPGRVVVQTYYPDHYAIRCGAAQSYEQFYEQELRFRRLLRYPPFTALANVVVRERKLDAAIRVTRQLQEFFNLKNIPKLRVLGPAPAPIARLRKDYRFHFLLKSPDRGALQQQLREMAAYARRKRISPGAVQVDVDPLSML